MILKGSLAVLYLKCLLTPGKDRIFYSKSAFRKLCHSLLILVFTLTIHQCITITYTSSFLLLFSAQKAYKRLYVKILCVTYMIVSDVHHAIQSCFEKMSLLT